MAKGAIEMIGVYTAVGDTSVQWCLSPSSIHA